MPGTDIEPRPDRSPVHVPGMPQPRRESEALIPRALRSARRNRHITVPLALPPVVWTAGEILCVRGLWLPAAGAAAAGAVATWVFAPHKWTDAKGEARKPEVWYARLSAIALAAYLAVAARWGATSGIGGEALGAFLVAGSLAWSVPWYLHKRPRGMKDRKRLLSDWEGWWAYWAPHWNLSGSRVISAEDNGVTVRLRIQLWAGHQTEATLRGAVSLVESALQDFAAAGGVSVFAVKGNKSQADVSFKRLNPLAEAVEWDEKLAPGSVLDPWHPGVTEGGRRRAMSQLGSMFALGETGSGKSTMLLTRLLSLCGCADALSVLIDLKGGRSARPVLETGAADYVVTTLAEAEMALMLAEAEIQARNEGAYDGAEQLTPTPLTPAMFFHADETHKLSGVAKGSKRAADSMSTIATTGRSAAVFEDAVNQYGSLEASVRYEETRMNLFLRFVFHMARAEMASFAINEYGQLDVSKLEGPGECFASEKGRTDPEKMRGVNITHDAFRALAPARIAKRGLKKDLKLWCGNQPCPAGGTWQQWWDSRWSRLPVKFQEISVQYREWAEEHEAAGGAEGAGVTSDSAPAAAAPELSRPRLAPLPPFDEDGEDEDGATAAARIEAETEGDDDIAPAPGASARAAEITSANQARFFALLAAAPPGGARTAELIARSGVSNGWAYDVLGRLADRGAAAQPARGLFAPVPGRDAAAEYAAMKAGDSALAKTAERRLASVG